MRARPGQRPAEEARAIFNKIAGRGRIIDVVPRRAPRTLRSPQLLLQHTGIDCIRRHVTLHEHPMHHKRSVCTRNLLGASGCSVALDSLDSLEQIHFNSLAITIKLSLRPASKFIAMMAVW